MALILSREALFARRLEVGKIPFGKYRGELIADVAAEDPRYLRWMLSGTDYGAENEDLIRAALQEAAERKIVAAPEIDLTDHQQERADKILAVIEDGAPVVRLEGGAGTGTVARTLKFAVEYRDGEQEYVHSFDTPIEAQQLLASGNALIVDECSMINDRDANLLLETAHNCGGHLILVGDSHQLPPVKQDRLSQCCGPLSENHVAELTVPMRYDADSHLYRIEQGARHELYELLYGTHPTLLAPSDQLTLAKNRDQVMARYIRYFREDPTAQHRMLLFRRRDVTEANNRIRRNLFGADAAVVEEDEQIMILRTGDTPAEGNNPVRYYSGQTYRVLDTQRDDYPIEIDGIEHRIPHYIVVFDDGRPAVRVIFGISETQMDSTKLGGPEYQRALQAAREHGLDEENGSERWKAYHRLLGDFVRVAYQYATSVHRAQGQTVDYAYCCPGELLAVRGIMGKALAYVALTRARKHLTVL